MNIEDLKNKVIQGDCLEVMKDIPDKSIDMILCDLPYGTTACKWDTIIPFEPLWEQYKRIIKDNGAIVLTASQPFTSALVMSNINMYRYNWVYEKNKSSNFMLAKKQPLKNFEDVCVFYKKQPTYNPQMEWVGVKDKRKKINQKKKYSELHGSEIISYSHSKDNGWRYPKAVKLFNNADTRNAVHPTQKPVALFEYLIKTYTNEGDLVLDNCAGSGTTGVACQNTNRNYILIEKEPEYVDIINKRLQ
jgi:site-specific DNA-methyltransferase (adenine-specific)